MKIMDAKAAINFYTKKSDIMATENYKNISISIEDCYKEPSEFKRDLFFKIWQIMREENGRGLCVISYNHFNFSAAYFSADFSEVILFYPSRWGVRVNIDKAAEHVEKYEKRQEEKSNMLYYKGLEILDNYLVSLDNGVLDLFDDEIKKGIEALERWRAYYKSEHIMLEDVKFIIKTIDKQIKEFDILQQAEKEKEDLERDSYFW